jgi:hypothetical protein
VPDDHGFTTHTVLDVRHADCDASAFASLIADLVTQEHPVVVDLSMNTHHGNRIVLRSRTPGGTGA